MTARKINESGSVLIVSLVILLVLTLLGLSGMTNTVMQERMAGNMQESMSAFQAAEAGLRDAEGDISANITPSTVFKTNCAGGLCEPASSGYDVWVATTTVQWHPSDAALDLNTRAYGSQTSAAAIPNVKRQPAYVIERLQVQDRSGSIVAGFASQPPSEWYRVTSKGFGRQGQAMSTVQAVIRR
jgi:type IV pilus assembly protein PilX